MSELEIVSDKEKRRRAFTDWLIECWEWASDNKHVRLTTRLAELVMHSSEDDYPLWEMARKYDILGDSMRAETLRKNFGIPPMTAERTGWEKEINYAPIIKLDEEVWRRIYNALGWANRDSDSNLNCLNFFLWSPQGNVVRFVMKQKEVSYESGETEETA